MAAFLNPSRLGCLIFPLLLWFSSSAFGQGVDSSEEIARLRAIIVQQQQQLETQQHTLDDLRARIDEIERSVTDEQLTNTVMEHTRAGQASAPIAPVGIAQAEPETPAAHEPERAALPEVATVLTRPGRITIEPSFEYAGASTNRLVFRGIEIVTGLQIGVIEASDVDRDTLVAALTARYGLADRLELELRAPYLYRHDRVTTLAQRDEQFIREFDIEGDGLGDIEAAVRYQINGGGDGDPIYIANLRLKSDTGSGPFDIARDEFGVLTELPTGSGFWALEPSLTVLLPSDPVVLYATLSYLAHLEEDIDREIGDVMIGTVDPGDSIGASLGFGFALNSRFSFSLGYKHNYIYPTETDFGGVTAESEAFQVGALLLGMAYQVSRRTSVNANFEFGATADAPDIRMLLRVPVAF